MGIATTVLALCAVFAVVGFVVLRGGGSSIGATGLLLDVYTGTGSSSASPEKGGELTAGIARVEVRPLALAAPATVSATLNADRSLEITMEPQLPLQVPALVTLPFPPGAETGENPARWPVALLESPGEEPLVLQAEGVSETTFAVLLPHFSKVTPMQQGDANARVGGASIGPGKPYSPAIIDASVRLPDNSDPNADVKYLELTVSAKARTSVNGGIPLQQGGQLAPGWERFRRLKVRVFESKKELKIGFLAVAEGEIVNGRPITLNINTTLWNEQQTQAAYVRIEDEDGHLLVVRSIVLPNGKYWKEMRCGEAGDYEDFLVHYLWDPRNAGHPDANYAAQATAKFPIPARVFDACEALTFAYRMFKSPRWFNDPGQVPSLPMDVWLQPWRENESGNVRNYVSLSTLSNTYDQFKRDAAHEMAHRFQHQYSIGYTGGWFHDASAEYLANRIYGSDEEIAAFIGLTPAWISSGFTTGGEVESYSASSFLAYLSSAYGINVARLWVDGASGLSNAKSWQVYIDSLLRPGLRGAWDEFSKIYLVDHRPWGSWTGVDLRSVFVTGGGALALGGGKPYYATTKRAIPTLSAGGTYIIFSGAPSATIGYRISAYVGDFERPARFWLSPGDEVDGRAEEITLESSRPLSTVGAFRVGKTEGAINDRGLARISYSFRDWEGDWMDSPLILEAWALPEMTGVEFDDKTGNLTWPKSPVEGLTDNDKRELFDQYELVARSKDRPDEWVVIEEIAGGKDTYEAAVDPAVVARKAAGPDVCVRVKDTLGNTSPEACPQQGDLIFRLTSWKATGDPKVAAELLGAGRKPNPSPTVICQSDPSKCFFAVLPVSLPTGPTAGSGAIPFVCTEAGLTLLKRLAYVDALREGSCLLVGGLNQPAGSGDYEGIPEMLYSLTPSKLKAVWGTTYGMSAGHQYNLIRWIDLEAVFAAGRVTGTLKLTDYSQYKSDGVWTPQYNPNGAIALSPPQFATITFEGALAK